jgi:DNA-binding response OmpR family regulator
MQLLIVEDDQRLARQLRKGLDEQGHSVTVAPDGAAGLESAMYGEFDVVVLDGMLPGLDGFSIVRRLRAAGKTIPILMLTARDAPEDVVTGLDAGADDYLTKPFSFNIFVARLRALSRRKNVEPRTYLQVGDLMLDPAACEVRRSGAIVTLTKTEYGLIELMMRNPGRVLTRARLIESIWGNARDVENNTLDVFIRQLRAKVDPPGHPKLIHTVRGFGYAMREEDHS